MDISKQQTIRKWLALIGICGTGFLAFLDFTVVNTALPVIQKQLNMTVLSLQWVLNIYLLVLALFMVVAGKLGDMYGHRLIFYSGSIIFIVASLIAGLSMNGETIIVSRFLQAIGAAIIFPIAASILSEVFHEDSTKALGIYGAIGGGGLAIGPLLGAFLTTHIGWRYIFFVNIPIGIISLIACLFSIPASKVNTDTKIDMPGLIFFIIGIGCIVLGVINSAVSGFYSASTLILLSVGFIAIISFVMIERKVSNPLVDPAMFTKPLFLLGAFSNMMGGVASGIGLFFIPLYLHAISNISVMNIGVILSSITFVYIISSMVLNRFEKKFGLVNMLVMGIAASVISALLQYFLNLETSAYIAILPCIFIGITWAVGNILAVVAAHKSVSKDKIGVATGMVYTLFDIGGSIALALATVIFNTLENTKVQAGLASLHINLTIAQHDFLQKVLANPSNSQTILQSFPTNRASVLMVIKQGFISGFHGAVTVLLIISIVTFLASLALLKNAKRA